MVRDARREGRAGGGRQAAQNEMTRDLRQFLFEHCFAAAWARPGLERMTRSIITISVLQALGRTEELKSHIRMGINNGLTREQLKEIFLHVGVYAGVPTRRGRRARGDGRVRRAGQGEGLNHEDRIHRPRHHGCLHGRQPAEVAVQAGGDRHSPRGLPSGTSMPAPNGPTRPRPSPSSAMWSSPPCPARPTWKRSCSARPDCWPARMTAWPISTFRPTARR